MKNLYKEVDTNLKLPCMANQFKQYMAKFNTKLNSDAKKIEETVNTRIPQLLVASGRGRKQQSTISKGGNLPEKLTNPQLTLSVRTIGKVMWSPLMKGVSQNTFVDGAIGLARQRLHRNKPNMGDPEATFLAWVMNLCQDSNIANLVIATGSAAASTYLEVYPDYTGNNAWDAAFGSP